MGCSLFSKSDDPVEQLPPITKEGKNTFGCLVNGRVWVPKGNHGIPNLDLLYDPEYNHGTFDLRTYRYPDQSDHLQYIILFSDSLSGTGSYSLSKGTNQVPIFSDNTTCEYVGGDADVDYWGELVITRFDLGVGIVSGTFELTLVKSDCDTIRMVNGRFDTRI